MENISPRALHHKLTKRSTMAEKFKMIPEGWKPPADPYVPDADALNIGTPDYFEKYHFFVHGNLMDKKLLAEVLDLPSDDVKLNLRPAQVLGYQAKLWDGMAYYVETEEEEYRLTAYKANEYSLRDCIIRFSDILNGDNEQVHGKTFVWNGNSAELTEEK
ncbi:hypothetical protein TEQG_06682 [Trichophyton equinum CBS 127.97]|uniref:Gamma-glutamylcyclotransferase AIG2-like domain-containing protein n=1 Tax=Trichophyton equinum (strain ATCC MYA-4606 / CBS 127.97) TaxID=559882 RepID=F2Q0N1_TRIEC|nr:hypothetical protein TEQG_06682 [Trichophyton equinum CBS 127.97]